MSFQWRHQYDDARDREEGDAAATVNDAPTKTIVSFKDDADINVMMKRFGVTDGAIPPAAEDPRYYGDFSDVPDYRQALDATRDAENRFRELPADLRNRFANDPLRLWEYVNDEKNHDEAVALGLLHRRVITKSEEEPAPTKPPQQPEN